MALCADCLKKMGGNKGVHDGCKAGAAKRQAHYDAVEARLLAGELRVVAAWGDWHENVPSGMSGVCFSGKKDEQYWLIPSTEYDPANKLWLSDYQNRQPWAGPDAKPETSDAPECPMCGDPVEGVYNSFGDRLLHPDCYAELTRELDAWEQERRDKESREDQYAIETERMELAECLNDE